MVDPIVHRKVVVEVLQPITAETRYLHARYVTEVLVISMFFKTMNVRIPVKSHLSVKYATRDLPEIITSRHICDSIPGKNHTIVHTATDSLCKLQTYEDTYVFTLARNPINVTCARHVFLIQIN